MAFLFLNTASFRNLADIRLDISAKDVFLVGENGQGKTNFLEALYFCSYASSFRGVKDSDMALSGETAFSASAELGRLVVKNSGGLFSEDRQTGFSRQIAVKVEKSKKTITLDGKKITDRKDLLETIPLVVFCHEDMEFVSGSQERRRWFFDQTQSLYDPVYLDDLRRYRHVLKTRNAVLKDLKAGADYRKAQELLDALDPQLAGYGLRLMEKRNAAAGRFSAVFSPLYKEVSGIAGIGVAYAPSWKSAGGFNAAAADSGAFSRDERLGAIAKHLAERRAADMAQGLTLSGPHRDRYLYTRSEAAAEFSQNASTGQRRLLALLLRIAQARCFSELTGKFPILLLDDVLLELDGEKRRRFLTVMPDYEQAFFTFLPEEPYKNYSKSATLIYHVKGGVIEESR